MTLTEKFANDAQTTLDGAIDDSQTAFNVLDASAFPTGGDFRIRVEDEYMLVTGVNAEEFTVEREIEGSVVAAHADTSTVTHVLTAGGLEAKAAGLSQPLYVYDEFGNPVLSVVDEFTGDDKRRKVTLYSQTPWDPDAPEDGNIEALQYEQVSVNSGSGQHYSILRTDGSTSLEYHVELSHLIFKDLDDIAAADIDSVNHSLIVNTGDGSEFAEVSGLDTRFSLAGWMDLKERASAPDAPGADTARLYTEDLGGKTALYVRFATGTPVKIAEEP